MRRPIVAGNWKMHGSREENARLVAGLVDGIGHGGAEVIVFPPAVYVAEVVRLAAGSAVAVGGQNLCTEAVGAYTGETSGAMLRDVGASHVLVGHSERRTLYGESEATVAVKFVAAQAAGLVPVLCVGESLEEREAGVTETVVARQLDAVVALAGLGAFVQALVAYEPVWAIGTGRTASPDQAQAVHAFIRGYFSAGDATLGDQLRVLYGGSVKASNAAELFGMADVDGALVGGASLKADEFLRICDAAHSVGGRG
ncbi:MAG: triose-phosphate isomerase [Pseudomonadota bacterium]|jgi:triosephosphate isomerase